MNKNFTYKRKDRPSDCDRCALGPFHAPRRNPWWASTLNSRIGQLEFVAATARLVVHIGGLLGNDIQIVLREETKIFPRLAEFSFLHSFSDVPVDVSSLRVHHVVLLRQSLLEDPVDGNVVGNHDNISLHHAHVVILDRRWRDVVQTDLESSGAPFDECDFLVVLDVLDSAVSFLRAYVSSVVQTDSHVLVFNDIEISKFDKEILWLEGLSGDLLDGVGRRVFVRGADDGGHSCGHEVQSGIRNEVRLEFVHVDVQVSLESKSGSQRTGNLGNDSVQVIVRRLLDVKLGFADAVDGFVVQHDGDVRLIQESVRRQQTIVWLHNTRRNVRRRVDFKSELDLFPVIDCNALENQHTESRPGSSSDGVLHKESLHVVAIVDQLANPFDALVQHFLSNGVVSPSEVVGSVFFSWKQKFVVPHLLIFSRLDVIDRRVFKIDRKVSGHEVSSSGFLEESLELVVGHINVVVNFSLLVDLVLHAVLVPNRRSHLQTTLAHANSQNFTNVVAHCY